MKLYYTVIVHTIPDLGYYQYIIYTSTIKFVLFELVNWFKGTSLYYVRKK